jgi:hypothetical protein
LITVIVTDNGVPPLSATQQFVVIVRDTLSDFTLTLGSTNVLTGESNSVPFILAASLPLTNLSFQVNVPSSQLTNLSLRLISPEIMSANLSLLGLDIYTLNFKLDPAQQTASVRPLALLNFQSVSNFHSAVDRVTPSQMLASQLTGRTITNGSAVGGRIIVVGREPILEIRPSLPPEVTLYGRPGAIYSWLETTNIQSGTWTEFARLPLTNRSMVLAQTGAVVATFFRALEWKAEPPRISLVPNGGPLLSFRLQGWPAIRYSVETSAELGASALWLPVTEFVLTNTTKTIILTNAGERQRFFRAIVP